VTSGEESGTSGKPGLKPWLVVTLAIGLILFVNTTSDILEEARGDHPLAWWKPVLWETSSGVIIMAMAPLIGWALQLWPFRRDQLVRFALIHFACATVFSLVHILAIWVMREAAYAAVGERYGFFDDGVALTMLYEGRKDVLVYAGIALVYWLFQREAARAAPAAGEQRIEIRDGGASVFLPPGDIFFVEAAGNYVEFHTAARTHLVRATLASYQERLAARGFVRVHRSRLVNRARIRALKPTPSGDLEITLDDGRAIVASRRYRAALEAPAQAA
jgi:LytTr DNA-binding domain